MFGYDIIKQLSVLEMLMFIISMSLTELHILNSNMLLYFPFFSLKMYYKDIKHEIIFFLAQNI